MHAEFQRRRRRHVQGGRVRGAAGGAGPDPDGLTPGATTTTATLRLSDPGVREQLEALPASLVLLGFTTDDGQPVGVDLDAEGPHVLVCTGTGSGATTILRTLTVQLLHHGSHALVLDRNRISHRWASGLPGVTYCREISDIHDALTGLRAELQHRLALIDQHGDVDDLPRLTLGFVHFNRFCWLNFCDLGSAISAPGLRAMDTSRSVH